MYERNKAKISGYLRCVPASEIIGEAVVNLQGENVGKEKLEAIGSGSGQ
jgi:hypothetical protein